MSSDSRGRLFGEGSTIDGKCSATRHSHRIRGAQQDAVQQPQLGLQETVSIGDFRGFERVAADQLGELSSLVRRRAHDRPHLGQPNRKTSLRESPGGFTTC
jgi:hypothetical protein